MKIILIAFLAFCLLTQSLAEENQCKKVCPKIRRPVSARRPDGSCATYANNCLLLNDILCHAQAFTQCYKGDVCVEDKTKEIQCGSV